VVIVVVIAGLLVGGGIALFSGSGTTSTPTSAPASPAAKRLVTASLAAAQRVGTFSYVSRSTAKGYAQVTVGDAGPTSGRQQITVNAHTFTVLVIGAACYFQGDAVSVTQQLGLPSSLASTYAGRWISLAPSDAPYGPVYAAVTAPTAIADNVVFRPKRETGITRFAGRRVIGVTGPMTNITVAGQTQVSKGTATLEVAAARPHLPARYTENGTIDNARTIFSMTFSHWGEPLSVTAPTGAVSFASIPNSGSGGATTPSSPSQLV